MKIKIDGVTVDPVENKIYLLKIKDLQDSGINPKITVKGNRETNKANLTELRKEFSARHRFFQSITVNKYNLNILDGVHRLTIFYELAGDSDTLRIEFVDFPTERAEIEFVRSINNFRKAWTINDSVKSYAKYYKDSWAVLKKWCDDKNALITRGSRKPIGYVTAANFLIHSLPSGWTKYPERLPNITNSDIEIANKLLNEVSLITTTSTYPGSQKPLLQAWKEVRSTDDCIVKYIDAISKECSKTGRFFNHITKLGLTSEFYLLKVKYNL